MPVPNSLLVVFAWVTAYGETTSYLEAAVASMAHCATRNWVPE